MDSQVRGSAESAPCCWIQLRRTIDQKTELIYVVVALLRYSSVHRQKNMFYLSPPVGAHSTAKTETQIRWMKQKQTILSVSSTWRHCGVNHSEHI